MQVKKVKTSRKNITINDMIDIEAQESGQESELEQDSVHASDNDFIDNSTVSSVKKRIKKPSIDVAAVKQQVLNKIATSRKQKKAIPQMSMEENPFEEEKKVDSKLQCSMIDQIWNQTMSGIGSNDKNKKGPQEMDISEFTILTPELIRSVKQNGDVDSDELSFYTDDIEHIKMLRGMLNETEVYFNPNCFRFWLPANFDPSTLTSQKRIYMMISRVQHYQKSFNGSQLALGRKQLELTVVVDLKENQLKHTRNNQGLIKIQSLDRLELIRDFARHALIRLIKKHS